MTWTHLTSIKAMTRGPAECNESPARSQESNLAGSIYIVHLRFLQPHPALIPAGACPGALPVRRLTIFARGYPYFFDTSTVGGARSGNRVVDGRYCHASCVMHLFASSDASDR